MLNEEPFTIITGARISRCIWSTVSRRWSTSRWWKGDTASSLVLLPLPGLLRLLCLRTAHLPRLDLCTRGRRGSTRQARRPEFHLSADQRAPPSERPSRPQALPVRHRRWLELAYFSLGQFVPSDGDPAPQASALCLPSKAPFLSSALGWSRPRRDLKLPSFQLATRSSLLNCTTVAFQGDPRLTSILGGNLRTQFYLRHLTSAPEEWDPQGKIERHKTLMRPLSCGLKL